LLTKYYQLRWNYNQSTRRYYFAGDFLEIRRVGWGSVGCPGTLWIYGWIYGWIIA
jgi:hypothetical protein